VALARRSQPLALGAPLGDQLVEAPLAALLLRLLGRSLRRFA
jgi:hypothetical protein